MSDEFTVPLCRGHHRELDRCGDEAGWWRKAGLDPIVAARALWSETHPQPMAEERREVAAPTVGVREGRVGPQPARTLGHGNGSETHPSAASGSQTSFKQIEANWANARRSTGPTTQEDKQRSRCNAIRHGLTAETVIGALEDADEYQAFEAAITADYDARKPRGWGADPTADLYAAGQPFSTRLHGAPLGCSYPHRHRVSIQIKPT